MFNFYCRAKWLSYTYIYVFIFFSIWFSTGYRIYFPVLYTVGPCCLSILLLLFSCYVQLFVTPWTRALQAPLSMEFSRQAYWSGLPFASPEDLSDPGIESRPAALQADSLPLRGSGGIPQTVAQVPSDQLGCHVVSPKSWMRRARPIRQKSHHD